ncbi:MAG: hypothetical protein V1773_00180 [bacterium]
MEQGTLPTTYKYKIDAEDFVKLLLADDDTFEELKQKLGIEGIERLTIDEIKQKELPEVIDDFIYDVNQKLTVLCEAQIEGDVVIKDQAKININPLFLFKSKFNDIKIEGSKIGDKNESFIGFLNCSTGNFNISSSTTGNFYISESTTGDFSISSITTGDFSISSSTTGNFNISSITTEHFYIDLSTIGYFSISSSTTVSFSIISSTTESFYIRSSTTGPFYIHLSTTGDFDISSSTTGDFDISSSTTGDFYIRSSTTGNFIICEKSTTGNFIIYEKSTTGYFDISSSTTGDFKADNLYNSFKISASNIPLFELKDCFIPKFRIDLANKIELYITGGQINLLDFSKSILSKDSIISITGSKVYSLLMEEFGMLGNLYFRQIIKAEKCFKWYKYDKNKLQPKQNNDELEKQYKEKYDALKNQYKKECTKLIQKYKKSTIHISQSSLGKTEFSDCPLNDFEFQFNNSNITSCFITGGTIPDDVKIVNTKGELIETGAEMYNQKASFFNQLRKIFEFQGDVYRATQQQAKWAFYQEKYLKLLRKQEKKTMSLLKAVFTFTNKTKRDKWAFWINRWSNNHEENWLLPIVWTLFFTVLLYLAYLCSIGRCFNGNEFDGTLFDSYLDYINPFNKSESIEGNYSIILVTKILAVSGKIFVGIGTYKFLSAFRKHSRRNN